MPPFTQTTNSRSALRLPSIFSEHLVLRAGRENPIWGWADAGAEIAVDFQGQIRTTAADASGRWRCLLPVAPAGGPYSLRVTTATGKIELKDILAGEVWLCSGQSNMEWTVLHSNNAEQELAQADLPRIRLLNLPHVATPHAQSDVHAAWTPCTPETVARFAAVGYFFGRDLQRALDVPIGLINSSFGGTVAEAWTPWDFLQDEPAFASFVDPWRETLAAEAGRPQRYSDLAAEWSKVERFQDPGNRAFFRGWADFDLDETGWRDFIAPGQWKEPDLHHRGAVWFRKEVAVPQEWAGRDLIVSLGALHDFDTTYFNGLRIGGLGKETMDAWMTPRYYRIPASLVRPGAINLIATRVFVEFDLGGFTGGAPLALYPSDTTPESGIDLAGLWKYRAEYAFDASVPIRSTNLVGAHNLPAHLFNGMIAPLVPFGLSGVIWYQGESNASRAAQYEPLFQRLIQSWRATFETADLPFLFVLLANHFPLQTAAVEGNWAELRRSQLAALALPHTAVASAIDVGDARDIHPRDKQSVGHRLALAARAVVYGEKIEYSGPSFQFAKREDDRVRLLFSHTGAGLVTRDEEALRGFAVRGGAEEAWHWAEAKIEEDSVLLQSADVPLIREAAYAWADNPLGNLNNRDGLPALPFRVEIA